MSTRYVVTGPCAFLTGTDPMTGATYRQLFYQHAPVPSSATDEEIEHNLATGLIAAVDEPTLDDGQVVLEEPARNGSTADWVAFALSKGATEADIDGLKRDDLVERYGTPPA